MDYREALPPVGRESSEFLKCACCFELVNEDGSDAGVRTPTSPPKRRSLLLKDSGLIREREHAWRAYNNKKERAWRFCYWADNTKFPLVREHNPKRISKDDFDFLTRRERDFAWRQRNGTSGTNFPFPGQNVNTGTLEDQHWSAEDGIGTLEPPEDKSITSLVIRGFNFNSSIPEQEIIDKFAPYGVIKSTSFFASESRALVTYTTREGAEKATQAFSKCLFINDQRLKLAWEIPHDHHQPLMNRPSATDLGAVISTQKVGGSSTAAASSSSNVPIVVVCQHCRATAAALEKESDATQMSLRLRILDHYQCPFWPVNQSTSPHVTQDSVTPSQREERMDRTNPKRRKNQ
ncbi:RNA recognition motif domain-containing protein [Hirschfeldia incana]|nr:RNA recognition motif domain-containing protein [Hirschfeldia incana]